MIERAIIIATANWALLVLPCICTGGYLRHACDCAAGADSSCCEAETECDCDDEQTGCGHESSCESDPCEIVVVARQEDPSSSIAIGVSPPIRFAATAPAHLSEWREFTKCELVLSVWSEKHIPFHESDVPLLI